MVWKQGIAFRRTPEFVTDGPDDFGCAQLTTGGSAFANIYYPIVSPQGNGVGYVGRDESYGFTASQNNSSADPRLAGNHYTASGLDGGYCTYRIDLPSPGRYRIRAALGNAAQTAPAPRMEVFDNTTSLAVVTGAATTTVGQLYDASGTLRASAADWAANNSAVEFTFASTVCLFKFGSGTSGQTQYPYIYIEEAGGASAALAGAAQSEAIAGATLTGGGSQLSGTAAGKVSATAALSRGAAALAGAAEAVVAATGDLTTQVGGKIAISGWKDNDGVLLTGLTGIRIIVVSAATKTTVADLASQSTDEFGNWQYIGPQIVEGSSYIVAASRSTAIGAAFVTGAAS